MLACSLAWMALFQTAWLISGALEVEFWRFLVGSMRFPPTSQLPSFAVGFMTLLLLRRSSVWQVLRRPRPACGLHHSDYARADHGRRRLHHWSQASPWSAPHG